MGYFHKGWEGKVIPVEQFSSSQLDLHASFSLLALSWGKNRMEDEQGWASPDGVTKVAGVGLCDGVECTW